MFPNKDFHIVHSTNIGNLPKILESQSLKPIGSQKNRTTEFYKSAKDLGDIQKYKKSIFYSIIFPDDDSYPIFEEIDETAIHFVFSPKLITSKLKSSPKEEPFFCKGWHYGKFDKSCFYYDKKLSLNKNLNNWRKKANKYIQSYQEYRDENPFLLKGLLNTFGTLNTELLLEGETFLDIPELEYIYVPEQEYFYSDIQESNYKKIEKLIQKYPELPWIRENPFYDYDSI
jgi:hypothetical protein